MLPGCPIGLDDFCPECHEQFESPSSSPFVIPSPSESFLHIVAFHLKPFALKSYKLVIGIHLQLV